MKSWISAAALLLALTACGGGGGAAPDGGDDSAKQLEKAAQSYSDAYLSGDAETGYELLSERCQERMTPDTFAALVAVAEEQYGEALTFKSFDADINSEQARVTYTYDVAAINQTDEPWVKEDGDWREDDC